jgi:hypothetical protein
MEGYIFQAVILVMTLLVSTVLGLASVVLRVSFPAGQTGVMSKSKDREGSTLLTLSLLPTATCFQPVPFLTVSEANGMTP